MTSRTRALRKTDRHVGVRPWSFDGGSPASVGQQESGNIFLVSHFIETIFPNVAFCYTVCVYLCLLGHKSIVFTSSVFGTQQDEYGSFVANHTACCSQQSVRPTLENHKSSLGFRICLVWPLGSAIRLPGDFSEPQFLHL